MSVFETVPDFWVLARMVDWIVRASDDPDDDLPTDILPELDEEDFDGRPWLRTAWASWGAKRVAALLRCALLHEWHEDELPADDPHPDHMAALEDWARKYAVRLRLALIEPATETQIADALGTLAEVLNQELAERTAAFIIEMIGEAKLPLYVVHGVFKRVAMQEAGKIKPASFTKLLETAKRRLLEARRRTVDAGTFVRELEPALAYLRDRMAEEARERGFEGGTGGRPT